MAEKTVACDPIPEQATAGEDIFDRTRARLIKVADRRPGPKKAGTFITMLMGFLPQLFGMCTGNPTGSNLKSAAKNIRAGRGRGHAVNAMFLRGALARQMGEGRRSDEVDEGMETLLDLAEDAPANEIDEFRAAKVLPVLE